jgi:16S rRNA (cytosine967-C5)-methyltransferase
VAGPRGDARRAAIQDLLRDGEGASGRQERAFAGLTGSRHAAALDLVQGVRRHVFLLDAVLRLFLRDPIGRLPDRVRQILRIGAYELLFRPAPPGIAVSAAVDQVGRSARHRGLVNAVLRKVATASDPAPEPKDGRRDAHEAWIAPGLIRRFTGPVLPDPIEDPVAHLSYAYTQTPWMVSRILEELPLEAEAFLRSAAMPLPVALRPTRRISSPAELAERLAGDGIEVVGVYADVVAIPSSGAVSGLEVVREGLAVVQDAVAASVAPFVGPERGERILDLCAAPGGKSIHLAELMGDQGEVVAMDPHAERLARVAETAERLSLCSVRVHDPGASGRILPAGPFDRVLVDAPCSNSGVLMKRVEARFRLGPAPVAALAGLQLQLLSRAASVVRPGGVLVYATCSILPEENQDLVRAFLAAFPGFRLEEERLRWPQRTGRDGGYMARLRAPGDLPGGRPFPGSRAGSVYPDASFPDASSSIPRPAP